MKLMFSMFAEDIGLLKNKVFAGILKSAKDKPAVLPQRMHALFEAMCTGGHDTALRWFSLYAAHFTFVYRCGNLHSDHDCPVAEHAYDLKSNCRRPLLRCRGPFAWVPASRS
jgi:hypothetical protein